MSWPRILMLAVLSSSCHSADRSRDRPGQGSTIPATSGIPLTVAPSAPNVDRRSEDANATRIANARRRAWPVSLPGRGLAFSSGAGAPTGPLSIASGPAASNATADRCPDHLECERIANNAADAAHYGCNAQCESCCPHASVEACAKAECSGARERCQGEACHVELGGDRWMQICTERCRVEMSSCAGCRTVWCPAGAALDACHADADRTHRETLRACDRDCPAPEQRADGSCTIQCGRAKTTCSQPVTDCKNGRSPDCRCECAKAATGVCLDWKDVCTCN